MTHTHGGTDAPECTTCTPRGTKDTRMRNYVVGLAHDGERMAFVKKNRPEWQKGKLNGIGGKVEPGETPEFAVVREFEEETGTLLGDWRLLLTMTYPDQATISFYTTRTTPEALNGLYTATDEAIEVHTINYVRDYPSNFIRNLHWIVPLALAEEEYGAVVVVGHFDPLIQDIKTNSTGVSNEQHERAYEDMAEQDMR